MALVWSIDAGALIAHMVPVLCIWREASNQGSAGLLAVSMVVRNRMSRRFQSAQQVCLAPLQFSSMSYPHDPGMVRFPDVNDESFRAAFDAWMQSSQIDPENDPVKGATLYYATYIQAPSWATSPKVTFVTQIGTQRFYREP